jgi:8-oxo-dGTP pyrophosphatase MutT (NUDIX family)
MEPTRSRSAGGIVIGDHGAIAMIRNKDGDGAWLFPKGHVEAGETDEQTARREIREEAGLSDLEFIDDLGSYERYAIAKDGSYDLSELKEVRMFLFAAPPHAEIAPRMTEEISEAAWIPFRELSVKIGNEKERLFFASVTERVRQAIQRD